MSQLVHIPFHGDDVLAAEVGGKPHAILRPIVEALGVDYSSQLRRLKRKSWAAVVILTTQDQHNGMVAVDLRTLGMWLATITEHRVAEHVRPKLVAYQAEVADVIEAYWTKGGAINPRATDEQLNAIIGRAERQMGVLRLAEGLIDRKWLEAKARHVAARALGEEPEVDFLDRPLTVGEYFEEHGFTAAEARSLSPRFGKIVKRLYGDEHNGKVPDPVDRFIDGAMRKVAGYVERDRPLFDAAIREMGLAR